MSQIVATSRRGNTVRFGLDHAIGWFLMEEKPGEDEPLLDICSFFDGLSHDKLLEWLLKNLPASEVARLRQEIEHIAMDLDPGEMCSRK